MFNCPSDIRTSLEVGLPSIPVYWIEPFAIDGSGRITVTRRSHTSGQLFPIAVTHVSYVFVDSGNNQATCNFSVTVEQGISCSNKK